MASFIAQRVNTGSNAPSANAIVLKICKSTSYIILIIVENQTQIRDIYKLLNLTHVNNNIYINFTKLNHCSQTRRPWRLINNFRPCLGEGVEGA